MIYKYGNDTLLRWSRGELKVQLDVPHQQRPMGYCDGTPEDEAELRAMAEEEDVENLPIHKRILKTGREIWTLGDTSKRDDEGDDD